MLDTSAVQLSEEVVNTYSEVARDITWLHLSCQATRVGSRYSCSSSCRLGRFPCVAVLPYTHTHISLPQIAILQIFLLFSAKSPTNLDPLSFVSQLLKFSWVTGQYLTRRVHFLSLCASSTEEGPALSNIYRHRYRYRATSPRLPGCSRLQQAVDGAS
jgi:hypothetical protein